jgi:hypothetical protein
LKDRWTRWFWTEMGRRMSQPGVAAVMPSHVPGPMASALAEIPPGKAAPDLRLGESLTPRAARHIYSSAWKELRACGFSRPLRLEPWPGIHLLLPFYRSAAAVIPQGFPERVPAEARILSLAGRTGAASLLGVELWILTALWDDGLREAMARCGLKVITLDRVGEVFG